MNNKTLIALSACLIPCLTHANVIWTPPIFFINTAIFKTWFLIFISIALEAFFLYLFLRPISPLKALTMSCVGNGISTLCGIPIYTMTTFLFDATKDADWIATIIIMCLLSISIEFVFLRLIYEYPRRQLFIPVLIGNLSTYLLSWGYYYLYMPEAMHSVLRIFG